MSSVFTPIVIDLNVGDQLTTISCGHIIVELVKFLAYQRLQIPFTYQWLKQIITNKKVSDNPGKRESLVSERHFRTASTAMENLDFMIKSLRQEVSNSCSPEEVCILLGPSPFSCKEVYRLILPTYCHKPQCHSVHIASDQKIQRNVFRALVTSEKLSKIFFDPLPPTNTYIFIKKKSADSDAMSSDSFVEFNGCRFPRNCKIVVIDFRTQNDNNLKCCNDIEVFGQLKLDYPEETECSSDSKNSDFCELESTNQIKWYQSTYIMKGFKDCVVNGSSVTNLWLTS